MPRKGEFDMLPLPDRAAVGIIDLSEQTPRKLICGVAGSGFPAHFLYADRVVRDRAGFALYTSDGDLLAAFSPDAAIGIWSADLAYIMTRTEHADLQYFDDQAREALARRHDPEVAEALDVAKLVAKAQRHRLKDEAATELEGVGLQHPSGKPIGNIV